VLSRDCRTLVAQYRRDLEAQLQQRDVRQEIERLRETYPVFRRYPSVQELAALVRPGNPAYADKDAVLFALLAEIKRDAATKLKPRLFPLLNLIFWDNLMTIFQWKRWDCPNPADLFSEIQVRFFQVAVAYPLDRRPRKVNINLYRDTRKKVSAWQKEEAKHREPCQPLGPADEAHIILGDPREAEVHPEDMEEHLLGYVYQGVINETQYDLLLETEVYKRICQKEWAEAHGVTHATVRSWRHRAEQAIREYEKARQETGRLTGL
jgi:hypothetical protein